MRKLISLPLLMVLSGAVVAAQNASPAPAQNNQQPAVNAPAPAQPQLPAPPANQRPMQIPSAGPTEKLTVQDAEALALKNNPQISVAHLLYLASNQVTREQRSAYYPSLYGDLTAVDSNAGSRIGAGNLNNPTVYDRAAAGVTMSQLITDFGRTHNLVAAAALRAKAANMNSAATNEQIRLMVDEAFYNALQAKATEQVAESTVNARQVVSDQITTLYNNKLRSELDASFADANLAQAKLLLLDAQNNYEAALSGLSEILGYPAQHQFELVDTDTKFEPPTSDVSQLQAEAFNNRPEIASQNFQFQAAQKFQKAERDLLFPTVDALGTVGRTPWRPTFDGTQPFTEPWYGAVGVNLSIPIFNGFLYPARSKEASLRAEAASENLRDLKDKIANDVRTSWLNAITAYNRIGVSQQFVAQADLAINLSQTRYNLGLSSIVELTQAQLQQTSAQIQFAAAQYQYRIAQSVLRFQIAAP